MLRTIAAYMVVLWLLLIAFSQTGGGWIHVLLPAAVILVLLSTVQEKRSSGKNRVKEVE